MDERITMRNATMRLMSTLRREAGMFRARYRRPVITNPAGKLAIGAAPYTFVCVAPPTFKQNELHASTLARLGYCHAFEQLGIPYHLVGVRELAATLPDLPNPICLLQNSDYLYIDGKNLAALRRARNVVWLDYWFRNDKALFERKGWDYQSFGARTYRAVLQSEPAFAFTISPASSLEYYEHWQQLGLRVESLPLACDPTVYHPNTPDDPQFANIKMAFVGGYWPYKAMQFDRYLRPYEKELTVFGRKEWPYAGYGGQLPLAQEPALYRQARLSPAINEPHCEELNLDLNERVFKVLGSGGCAVTDAIPGYREWFDAGELLVPATLGEYHELVQTLLEDDALNQQYRQSGYRAVMARHTYAQRAKQVLAWLGISLPVES
jgi:hypothetical protein